MQRGFRTAAKGAAAIALAALAPCGVRAADPTTGPVGETRDVLMMLDSGPVHLRFHLA